ncbi:MAG: ammonia channel protein, partial [Stellaceae bacterium]
MRVLFRLVMPILFAAAVACLWPASPKAQTPPASPPAATAPAAAATPATSATPAAAPTVPKIDSGDTAWMLTSVALVLMMTIPGLALFYGGMV